MQYSRLATAALLGLAASALIAGCSHKAAEQAAASPSTDTAAPPTASASVGHPTQVFFGDTHLHTAMSMDAGLFGNRLGVEDAYRFARGEEVMASSGQKAKLSRPLDFLVVADHSDNMGFCPRSDRWETGAARRSHRQEMVRHDPGRQRATRRRWNSSTSFSRGTIPEKLMYTPGTAAYGAAWKLTVDAAEKYNEPGKFTAFIGYEWTSQVPPGNNLHRVVIYRDGADKAGQTEPFTTYPPAGSTTPEDLWKVLQAYEDKTGGQVLAIAHNGNLSNGMMFPWDVNPADKQPLTREYAADAHQLGASVRGDPDQGRRRSPHVSFPERRARRLRNLGQGQSQSERAQEERDAARRVRAHGAADWSAARAEAGCESLQVRHDRFDRRAHIARDRR